MAGQASVRAGPAGTTRDATGRPFWCFSVAYLFFFFLAPDNHSWAL